MAEPTPLLRSGHMTKTCSVPGGSLQSSGRDTAFKLLANLGWKAVFLMLSFLCPILPSSYDSENLLITTGSYCKAVQMGRSLHISFSFIFFFGTPFFLNKVGRDKVS